MELDKSRALTMFREQIFHETLELDHLREKWSDFKSYSSFDKDPSAFPILSRSRDDLNSVVYFLDYMKSTNFIAVSRTPPKARFDIEMAKSALFELISLELELGYEC